MVQTAEACANGDAIRRRDPVSGYARSTSGFVRNSRSQCRMRSFTVVMRNPLCEDSPEMLLIEGNPPIEALVPGSPNEAFAVCVCLRSAHRRSQHLQRHRIERIVDGSREDAVAIVDEEAIAAMKREATPKLLERLFSPAINVGCVGSRGVWILEDVNEMNSGAELCGQCSRGGECSFTWRAEISRNENASETASHGVLPV
jgi:hypothetical protein